MNTVENYIAPGSIEEAAAALAAGPVTIVAGGTDLMLQTGSGAIAYAKTLMNVRRIAEMQGVSIDGDTIRIGALTTITELKSDAIIAEHLPVVAEMADKFASDQIRNASTIGGNICNASPAGDGIVPLMMYGADVVLASAKGNRNVALSEFFTGPGKTVKADNELLVAIEIAKPAAGFKGGFGNTSSGDDGFLTGNKADVVGNFFDYAFVSSALFEPNVDNNFL